MWRQSLKVWLQNGYQKGTMCLKEIVLKHRSMDHFKEDWEDPAKACSSDATLRQQPPREFLNEERSRMGFDHDECKCKSYACMVGAFRNTVKFLQMVREVYKGSDKAYVFDTCIILLDKMLHGEIDHRELFNRLHCMFVNDDSLVQALLWLGAPNLIWTPTEVEERIRGFEEYFKERIRERIREFAVKEQERRIDQMDVDLQSVYLASLLLAQ